MGSLFQTLIVALSESGLGCPAHVYNGWKLKEAGLYINIQHVCQIRCFPNVIFVNDGSFCCVSTGIK